MKNRGTFNNLMFTGMAVLMFLSSCRNPCKNIECQNGGTCEDGECICVAGYEGERCEKEVRQKFIGIYLVEDNCSMSGTNVYNVQVSKSAADVQRVLISNFWELFENNIIAEVSGELITIPRQEPDNDDWFVEGNGNLTNESIQMDYTITTRQDEQDICNSTWTKQ